jgi:hypothetical protein
MQKLPGNKKELLESGLFAAIKIIAALADLVFCMPTGR